MFWPVELSVDTVEWVLPLIYVIEIAAMGLAAFVFLILILCVWDLLLALRMQPEEPGILQLGMPAALHSPTVSIRYVVGRRLLQLRPLSLTPGR